jgi:hypothetical protein
MAEHPQPALLAAPVRSAPVIPDVEPRCFLLCWSEWAQGRQPIKLYRYQMPLARPWWQEPRTGRLSQPPQATSESATIGTLRPQVITRSARHNHVAIRSP